MTDDNSSDRPQPIARAALPDLATTIGLAGRMRHVEVGGSACSDSGIAIATILFGITEQ